MTLDMRTIIVMLAVSAVLMTVTLTISIRAGRGGGIGKWSVGLALYATGWLLAAARGHWPDLVAVAVGDAFLAAGLCAQWAAIIEYGGGRAPLVLLLAPPLLLLALVIPLLEHYVALTLVVSLVYAALFTGIAISTVRHGARAGPARWMLAAAYAAAAVLVSARALDLWLRPGTHPSLFSGGALQAATFVALFAITVVGSTAFLLMLRQRDEAELQHLATFDPLTGLFNRRAFFELAERELARARRSGAPAAVLMMDLDHFKRVNDEFGHQAGDRVLAAFAAILARSVRPEDLVGRYGGEEFCVVLPGTTVAQAVVIAERLRQAVAAQPLAGLPRITSVSIGATACSEQDKEALDAAIARADAAMYHAKSLGRDRVVTLDRDTGHGASSALRRATEELAASA